MGVRSRATKTGPTQRRSEKMTIPPRENPDPAPTHVPEQLPEDGGFSVARLARAARKHALLVVTCWLVVIAIGFFWTLGQSKIYRAEAVLRLSPEAPRPLGQRVELVA